MRIVLCLILLMGLLATPLIAIADKDKPAMVFDKNDHTIHFRVFRFYDLTYDMLCYANKTSIHCTSYSELSGRGQQEIYNLKKKFPSLKGIINLP